MTAVSGRMWDDMHAAVFIMTDFQRLISMEGSIIALQINKRR